MISDLGKIKASMTLHRRNRENKYEIIKIEDIEIKNDCRISMKDNRYYIYVPINIKEIIPKLEIQ